MITPLATSLLLPVPRVMLPTAKLELVQLYTVALSTIGTIVAAGLAPMLAANEPFAIVDEPVVDGWV